MEIYLPTNPEFTSDELCPIRKSLHLRLLLQMKDQADPYLVKRVPPS